jgi:hypothetical protein
LTDLSSQLLARLEAPRFQNLDLAPGAIHPAYDGLSLLNLPGSLCAWLGAPNPGHPPLDIAKLDELAEGVKKVVMVLIDAVSFDRFLAWFSEPGPELDPESDHSLLAPLTSVVPSTTSSALATLWTGRSPAEHGIVGYELLLKEYGLVANMILQSPVAFGGDAGLLQKAGFRPENALPVTTLGSHLAKSGIGVSAFLPRTIRNSGLSQSLHAGAEVYGYSQIPDLWTEVCQRMEEQGGKPQLIWIYFGNVDGISHRFGPDSNLARAEFGAFIDALRDGFVASLSSQIGSETLLLLLADHGQVFTRRDSKYELRNHPSLARCLHILPTGENRMAYLYARPGRMKVIADYFESAWAGSFTLLGSVQALRAGLFGPGEPAAVTRDRLGDLIAIANEDAYLWWAPKENPLVGRHGGLSAEEMIVPLLAVRLG